MICSHGREGVCLDDATPAARERFELAHRMAFSWAVGCGVERDCAERFAGAYAAEEFRDEVDVWPTFPRAFEEWAKAAGEWIHAK